MSSFLSRWDFIDSNDRLMLLGIFLFLIGGFGVSTSMLPLDIGFITAFAGLIMYVGAMFTLSREINVVVESAKYKR